jgi:CO/xanthine dehydrogenase Mo-binding subunit
MNQGGDPSQAWIKMKPDGHVDVFSGTVDVGQGSKTVHTQIVADALGVPYDWVTMNNADTDSSPLCTGTFASRGTFIGGNAVYAAAKKTRESMLVMAADMLEADLDDLEVIDGQVGVRGVPERALSVSDVAAAATWTYATMITGSGGWMKPFSAPDPDTGECDPHAAISYAACVANVEVDNETGEVAVLRLNQAYDVGRAINPVLVEGQIEGGGMMGLGLALLEQSFPYYPALDARGDQYGIYLMPGIRDLPEFRNIILENPSSDGPFGAKAIGEMASNAQAPAICAAIYDAVGVWLVQTPATPEQVLRALAAKDTTRPHREGKTVAFDEELSIAAIADPASPLHQPAG